MSDDTEDQKWVDALGGKLSDPASPSAAEREATVIRNVLLRELAASPIYEPSQAWLDKLMAEADRRGLLTKEKTSSGLLEFINRIYQFLAMPASVMASFALVLGLSITVGYQAQEITERNISEDQIVRGAKSAERVTRIVASPMEAAQAWQKDLLAAGVEFAVSYEEPKRVLIRIRLTLVALELLSTRSRIQAPPGEWVTLVLETGKTGSQ